MAVVTPSGTSASSALSAMGALAGTNLSAQQTLEEIVRRVVGVVDTDAFFAGANDLDTGLCLGAGVARNFGEKACHPFWEHEFLVPDYNKFSDLTPESPVGDLRQATGGRLERSARYRMLSAVAGFEDELRVTWHAGGRSWGNLQLNRTHGGRPFTEDDRAFLRAAAPLASAALRRAMLDEPARTDPARGPGMAVLDPSGGLQSATAEAEAWLDELAVGWPNSRESGVSAVRLLLTSLSSLVECGGCRRTRLRTPNGTWLIAHASPLGDTGQVAMVIEPAKASEIAPIVVRAYGLTPREVQITQLIARGLSTEKIAASVFLSRHTIRDHLKAIFEKVGVSSRGELTSKLFVEHYHEPLAEAIAASGPRVDAFMGTYRN